MKDLTRLKVALAEQKKREKWLAEQLRKDTSTVSKWCSNKMQLSESGLGSKEHEENIKERFPKTYITLMDFSKECDTYLALINECDIYCKGLWKVYYCR